MAGLKGRYFFGLHPSEAVRTQLQQLCQEGRFGKGPFHHPLDWHLTLAFLGDLSLSAEVLQAQVQYLQVAAFDLCLNQVDYWPKPRVLVLCPDEPPEALFTLVQGIWEGLAPLGLMPEKRPFRPHLTLGRKAAPMQPGPCTPGLCWRVDEFGLFVSDWSRPAPRYECLVRQSLL